MLNVSSIAQCFDCSLSHKQYEVICGLHAAWIAWVEESERRRNDRMNSPHRTPADAEEEEDRLYKMMKGFDPLSRFQDPQVRRAMGCP
jgi:hypothetical protein